MKAKVVWTAANQICNELKTFLFGPPVSAYVPACNNSTVVGFQPWKPEVEPSEKLSVQYFQDVRAKPDSAGLQCCYKSAFSGLCQSQENEE